MRTHYSGDVSPELDGETVTLAGWVHEVRDLGKLKFLVLRDRAGMIQVTAKEGVTDAKAISAVDSLSRESVLQVTGLVKSAPKAPGGVEINPTSISLIASAQSPLPLDVTGKVDSDLDTRLNNRFMDVRKPQVQAIFKLRSKVLEAYREFFLGRGFIEINPPSIIAAASEGGTNLFPITYFEREAFLCQSPQLYKQMIMSTGLDRVFITQPVFRAEPHNTPRHLNEIFMLDVEKAFIEDEEGVMEELEGVLQYILKKLADDTPGELELLGAEVDVPKLPLKRIDYDDALDLLAENNLKIEWGEDIPPEGERKLHELFNAPYFIKRWPTQMRAFYSRPLDDEPRYCSAFDLDFMGLELSSGAQRIHDHDQLVEALESKGLNPENFEFYLKAFRYGMPPHGGWGLGVERILTSICKLTNVRETVLWPRDRHRIEP
ncbi:MAG: aspartate--tRNA(Asn) ligase [Candidatus Altiarchaeales archaeon]|nr:aspartate--tRNA(Asn) ligase [Candidatus Altiarchaeales archaeon]MBD3415673.1 aspartate--tRNA(Asn) ligase [Candidatus Altiarchaeales archaeon]